MNDRDPQFGGRQHSARSLALEVLFESRKGDLFVQELLERAFARTNLSPPDRRLVTHLSNGVLRRHGSLDTLIRPLVNRPAGQVEPWLWDALRLGAFQIAYLSNIPAHAAVHETVELAAQFQNERAKGFLNGVLRSFQSLMTSEFTDAPAADALPLEEGRYRRLSKPALPEPATDRLEYLAAGFSLPRWLAGRWLERYY